LEPQQHTAKTQARLAFYLIMMLAGVFLSGAALLVTTKGTGLKATDVPNFFGAAFAAVVTLAAAATSF
jgi:hypothetical protein